MSLVRYQADPPIMENEYSPNQELEAYRETVREGIEMAAYSAISGVDEDAQALHPALWSEDPGELEDMTPEQQAILREEIYKFAGIDPEKKTPITQYGSPSEEGVNLVYVFEGSITDFETGEEKPYFLHEIEFPNGETEHMISSSSDPLPELL